MVEKRHSSEDDPRYGALRSGIEQLNRHQLTVLVRHVESGSPMVVDGCNYEPLSRTWCPLAVALEVDLVLRDEGIAVETEKEAKELILSIGTRTNPGFHLNPMSGIAGAFFTTSRRSDLLRTCRDVLAEETFYRG